MRSILRRTRAAVHADGETVRANTMKSVGVMGLAAAILFLGLAVVALGGGDGGDTGTAPEAEVLGATVGPHDELEVASTEGGAFFTYAQDPRDNIAGSATVIVQGEGDVTLTVVGTPKGAKAVISATVENATGGAIVFPDGLSVAVSILRDGLPWRTVEPADIAIGELAPGETANVTTEVSLDGFGEYELSGEVLFARA